MQLSLGVHRALGPGYHPFTHPKSADAQVCLFINGIVYVRLGIYIHPIVQIKKSR